MRFRKIGDPSKIKHVFMIIRENRTYDQVLGDVAAGNGDSSLAVFGGKYTPNAHKLVTRFPLLDNFYDPTRQSADGHHWLVEGMAPYADEIQSPDWVRSYPGGNAGDSLAYQNKGFLFSEAAEEGLGVKIYGEYVENDTFLQPNGSTKEPSWNQFYNDTQNFESGAEKPLYYQNTVQAQSSVPAVYNHRITNFPQFDLGIPDQFRVDLWQQDFNKDVAAGKVPALSILWVMDDHTGGPPTRTPNRPITTWPWDASSTPSATATCGPLRRSSLRKTTRKTASTTSTVIAARAISSAPTLCRTAHRPHLLHAGQHDADDRANPRSAADEPVRPRGLADDDGFCSGHAACGQFPTVDARAEPGPAGPGCHDDHRIQPNHEPCGQGPEGSVAAEEEADLRRQTYQARRRRSRRRQPLQLVHVDRVYAALSRREQGSPTERIYQTCTQG